MQQPDITSTYSDRIKRHLATYKRETLGVLEDGIWARNSRPYPHILPIHLSRLNVVEPVRDAFWPYAERKGLTRQLHRDFHHLNSSQALAFNLFFTFVALPWSQPQVLLAALGLEGKRIQRFAFEYVPDREEGTNFDFFASFSDSTRLLVEVKLTEAKFGRCRGDQKHDEKRRLLYAPRLANKVSPRCIEPDAFFCRYQLLRNLSHLGVNDTLMLLVPRANVGTYDEGHAFIANDVAIEWQSRVRIVALEDLVNFYAPVANPHTTSALAAIQAKYLAHDV